MRAVLMSEAEEKGVGSVVQISVLYPGTEAAQSVYPLPVCAEWEEQRLFPASGSHHDLLC